VRRAGACLPWGHAEKKGRIEARKGSDSGGLVRTNGFGFYATVRTPGKRRAGGRGDALLAKTKRLHLLHVVGGGGG